MRDSNPDEEGALFRKHTRRAVKAAFAVALGVALLLGVARGAQSFPGPTISLGTKDFSEEFLLGQLYKQALEAKAYKVSYHENVGSTEIIDSALTSGKINMYPEYTGTILTAVFHKATTPKSASATYALAKKLEEQRGFTLFAPTPFYNRDAMGVLTSTAKKYNLKTVGDLKKVPNLSICGFPEFQKRWFGTLKRVYGISGQKFVPLAGISFYAALDAGKCKASDVFTTDPPLAGTKYTVLKDPKAIFGFQNVAPVVSTKVANALGSRFRQTVDAVSAKLTLPAIRAMNKAVYVDKRTPAKVAGTFLQANGLK
jgi:osmoprotectant transport system substrate-binding protein